MSFMIEVNPSAVSASMLRVKEQLMLPDVPEYPKFSGDLGQLHFSKRIIERDAAINIGYGNVFSTSYSQKEKLFLLEYLRSKEILTTGNENPLLSVNYAAGFRVSLFIREIEGSAKINISQLAAQAELGFMEVSVDIKTIGMPKCSVDIPNTLMGFNDFSQQQIKDLNSVSNQLEDYARSAQTPDLDPSIIFVTPKQSLGQIRIVDAESVLYSMERIQDKDTLKEAIEKKSNYDDTNIDLDIVRHVYAYIFQNHKMLIPGDSAETTIVENEHKNEAKNYLNKFR